MPTVGFAMDNARSVSEGDGSFAYRLILSEASTQVVTVTVNAFDLQDGSDFASGRQTITFQPGQTSAEGRLAIIDDGLYEARESVYLAIDFAHNAQIAPASSSINVDILDNEPATDLTVRFAPPTTAFNAIRVSEDAGLFSRDIVLSRPSTETVSVVVGGLPGTQSSFDTSARTLVFQPGETVKPFVFAVRDDLTDEPDEGFQFNIRGATNAALDTGLGTTQINGYIVDNDAPTGPTVRFASAPANLPVVDETAGTVRITLELTAASTQTISAVVEDYSFDGGGTHMGSRTVTFRPGQTSAAFDLAVIDNDTPDSNPSIQLYLGSVAGATPDYSSGSTSALTVRVRDDERVNVTRGSDQNDSLVAGFGANDLLGLGGDDRLISRGYDNHIFGGDGIDTAVYLKPAKAYDIRVDGTGTGYVHARDLLGVAGYAAQKHDSLDGVERIEFSDGTLTYDTQSAAAQVYRLYDAVLARVPDYYGGQGWTHVLEGGVSLRDVAAAFTDSAEFQRLTAGYDHAQLVEYLYQTALGRASDPAGKAGWVGFLDAGGSIAQLVVGFSESREHIDQTRSSIDDGLWTSRQSYADVEAMYQAVLGRAPDAGGLTGWANALENGLTKPGLAASLVGSREFAMTTAGDSHADIVDHFYETALHRAADPAGKAGWTAFLDQGGSIANLALAFEESAEFHALNLPNVDYGVSFSGNDFLL